MQARHLLAAVGLVAATTVAQNSSTLDRPDYQLSTVQGVINSVSGSNFDAGYGQHKITSPKNFVAAGAGVATPRLVYALHPDLDGSNNVVLQVTRSLDGGRNWELPVTAYTCDTPGGEDLNSGDQGTRIYAWGDEVYVTFHTNAHNKTQGGQSLWVVASPDQGVTWSPALNVSTGWNRGPGMNDWDVDDTRSAVASTGLHMVWEADFEDPLNPGSGNAAPNNNENLYYARAGFVGSPAALALLVAETPLTAFPMGGADVNIGTTAAQDNVVLVTWNDASIPGVSPNGRVTYSTHSFDIGTTFSAPFAHSGNTVGTFGQAWADPRRPWALLDGTRAFVMQEDSRFDEDDLWMDRGDIDLINGTINWNVSGVMCNHTSTVAGSGDIDGIVAAVHNGVLAVMYRDDSAGMPLDNSNEAYLVVDQNGGDDFINGTFQRHTVTTTTATLFDVAVVNNVIAGAYEECVFPEECGVVLSSDRGSSIESFIYTTMGSCSGTATNFVDVDDPFVAVTLNGDYNLIYADQRLGGPTGGNPSNVAWVTGGKYPRLSYDGPNVTMTMDKIDPAQAVPSAVSLLMLSAGTAGVDVPPSIALAGGGRGYFVGLTNDLLYNLMWNNVNPFIQGVSPTGTVSWFGIPNASALFGIPIYIVGGTADLADLATDPFKSYTDPITQ